MATILKWAGNKTAIMPELIKHLPANAPRLVEPFAGSCAVMMATDFPAYLVADINPDLINMYQQIKNDPEFFIMIAQGLFKQNSKDSFGRIRHSFNYGKSSGNVWRAAAFLYLNRHCYRGLCRYNKSGGFNVPYGNYKSPYFPLDEILAFAQKACRATFVCASYAKTLEMLRDGDVIYCDPPYDETFSNYHTAGFSVADHRLLASILEDKSLQGHQVILSNSDTKLTRSLYRRFKIHPITAPRSLGVAAGKKKSADEIIATIQKPYWIGVDLARPGSDETVRSGVRL
ncbi:DNA adenine methylase [Salmonella enterica]|uniref:DNA adenine methylase n=1 Tax=Citrobacter freundii TaxID=546 RepID=UPI0014144FF8|nr:DNA adenine methylase [Citrobacter freundii]EAZ5991669.1 DNA adenine methylase [Salmonella enterica]EBY2261589.1 DNA adenine methylase [Salmonella enterica subsp. enterica serovar Newport]EBJ0730096.1 DNA adenine methylase [Salmonella enterica]ECO6783075.1 DNA adenine methylase [Salmonella enterica]ECO7514832.1 DNA adenine methylase [Salmonella enterica]